MRAIVTLGATLALLTALPAWAGGPVKVHLRWEYKDFPAKVELAEAQQPVKLWETGSIRPEMEVPAGAPIPSSDLTIEPGQTRPFVLIVRNPTDKPLYFFASPHSAQPAEASLGFQFKCLCVGEAYRIGPRGIWYRVVSLQLGKNFEGQELTLTHTIVGIDRKRAAAFTTLAPPKETE